MQEKLYAQVIVDLVSNAVDRPFQCLIPLHLRCKASGFTGNSSFPFETVTAYVVALKGSCGGKPREICLSELSFTLLPEFVRLSIGFRHFSRWIEAIYLFWQAQKQAEDKRGSLW